MKEKFKKYCMLGVKVLGVIIPLYIISHEIYGLYIDNYNFKQFEKVKVILKDLKKDDKMFLDIYEFNKIYEANIQSIKNCYYISNYFSQNKNGYTFAFLFESWFNQIKYKSEFFAYPKYDIPYKRICYNTFCDDANFSYFYGVIAQKCREYRK